MKTLRETIKHHGWIQMRIAEIAGIPENTLSQIINGRRKATHSEKARIVGAFNALLRPSSYDFNDIDFDFTHRALEIKRRFSNGDRKTARKRASKDAKHVVVSNDQ